jgi:hypothetical protein
MMLIELRTNIHMGIKWVINAHMLCCPVLASDGIENYANGPLFTSWSSDRHERM